MTDLYQYGLDLNHPIKEPAKPTVKTKQNRDGPSIAHILKRGIMDIQNVIYHDRRNFIIPQNSLTTNMRFDAVRRG